MRRTLLTFIAFLFFVCACRLLSVAQDGNSSVNGLQGQNRWVFGGNVALSFGSNFTVIGAAPTVGYRFTERLTAGAGALYFYQAGQTFGGQRFDFSIYGPQAFARYVVGQSVISEGDRLAFQSDAYLVNTEVYDPFADTFGRDWIPQLFVGGGYFTPVGGRTFMGLMVMWDVIQDRNAPFANPMIRGGVSIGI